MANRPGGVDSNEIKVGFESLQKVRSFRELEQLIEDLPVLSAPIFHSRLRSELQRQISDYGEPFTDFIQIYDYLFMSLHHRVYRKLIESVQPTAVGQALSKPVNTFAPSYFLELAAVLGNELPKAEGPILNPANNAPEIRAEIEGVVGRSITLPDYQPSCGSHWSLILVACPSCHHVWLRACAYAINLSQEPALIEPLQDGRLNNSHCPLCSEIICVPLRVWVQDGPGSGDVLAALSCAWIPSDTMFIYQPPPGTSYMEENNYILEIRFTKLLQRLAWDVKQNQKVESPKRSQLGFAIAYSVEEVSRYIQRMADTASTIPFAMEAIILEITRKLESGILPIYDAEDFIKKTVATKARDWPIISSKDPLANSRNPYNYLVLCLIAEASADARKLSNAERAILAVRTYLGFFSIQEVALAEAALARAADYLKDVPANDPIYTAATLSVTQARSQLFSFLGQHIEADHAREQVSKSPFLEGDSLAVRFTRQRLEAQEALGLKRQGKLAEALKIYPRCVEALEFIEKEVASAENYPTDLLDQIRLSLSGDRANCAAILITLADRLEAIGKLNELITRGADPDEVAQRMKSYNLELDDLPLTNDVIRVLEETYPSGFTPEKLFEKGRQFLTKALEQSEALNGWEFAGIQAHQLASLLYYHLQEPEAAQEIMRKAIDYASRAGDHSRILAGHFFFADLAIKEGNGPKALDHLLVSAREEIREQVGSGYYANPKGMRLPLSNAALRTVALGGDLRTAIMIAESLKVPTTAATMMSGLPSMPEGEGERPEGVLLNKLLARRELLRIKVNRKAQSDVSVRAELRHIEPEIEAKRKSLSLRNSRFTRWVDATNLDVSVPQALLRRLRRLGPRTTLLGILPVGCTVWSYAIWEDGYLLSELPLPPFNGQPPPNYVSPSESRESWEQEYLEQLAGAILEPLEARLDELVPEDRLIISTSDPLALVPFSALPYRGRPLCEHVCVTQTQGVGMLEASLDRAESHFNSILCVGDPSRPDRDELPDAHAEVVTVAGRFRESGKQAVLLARDNATVPKLKAEVEQHDVLHFACHAEVAKKSDELSRLLLASDLTTNDSGDLSEDRILSELRLHEGCLVNLAGCKTGVQNNSKGFLLGGLVPSFLIAGAGSVIGSLWDINDSEAASFQIEFYRLLLHGSGPAESLVKTQRACLRGELGPAMKDMNFWAGYVMYGVG